MAAWSPDQEDVGADFGPKRTAEWLDELNAGMNARMDSLSTPESPATTSEAFPIEVWTFFSDSDLDQLVVDACAEMGRREIERGRKS